MVAKIFVDEISFVYCAKELLRVFWRGVYPCCEDLRLGVRFAKRSSVPRIFPVIAWVEKVLETA
jgi:hypothetical protein